MIRDVKILVNIFSMRSIHQWISAKNALLVEGKQFMEGDS